ncbi:HEPN domain-containing protein [Larkinella arboricola]
MSEDLKQYLRKAQDYLTIAKNALHSELPIGAITPSYYCFFWVVRGLLYEKGIVTKRHSGAREMFSLHYIKTGEFLSHLVMTLVFYSIGAKLPTTI